MRYRLVLGLSVLLAACSSSGSNNMPAAPVVPWGSFRHDTGNSAAAGLLNQNNGNVSMICSVAGGGTVTQCPGAMTDSSPAVDHDGNILLGTDNGVASFGPDGRLRWSFEGYETTTRTPHQSGCAMCTPSSSSPTCFRVGRVSASPTVTPGNTIVFGTEGTAGAPGHLFALQQANGTVTCNWIFPNDATSGIDFSSSAATQISNLDFTLTSAFVGADDGQLRAFNSDGTVRWSFANRAEAGPVTSSPALDGSNNVYITTADGVLSAVNFTGGQVWQSPIGIAAGESPLYPSPGVSTSVYAIGAGGTVFAISPSSQPNPAPKWQFTPPTGADGSPIPIVGSPAFITQSFPVGAADNSETVVYVVDTQGTAFGLRDFDGQPFPVQRCTGGMFPPTPTQSCKTDSCQPPTTCNASTTRCELPTPSAESSSADSPPGAAPPAYRSYYTTDDNGRPAGVSVPTPTPLPPCTRDTCVVAMRGTCETSPATIEIPSQMVQSTMDQTISPLITTSPVVSGDFFAVVGTVNGYVCARSFDPPYGVVPGYNLSPVTKTWGEGVCSISGTACVIDKDCPTVPPATPATPGPTPTPGHEACIPGGCIQLNADGKPTLSSPIIGENGAIYVTTADGLYVIK